MCLVPYICIPTSSSLLSVKNDLRSQLSLERQLRVDHTAHQLTHDSHLSSNHKLIPSTEITEKAINSLQAIEDFFALANDRSYVRDMLFDRTEVTDNHHCALCSMQAEEGESNSCQICGGDRLLPGVFLDNDTILTAFTRQALIESAKVMMFIARDIAITQSDKESDEAVSDKDIAVRHYYALIRPPGHHACSGHHEGFCIFNNAIIFAEYLFQLQTTSYASDNVARDIKVSDNMLSDKSDGVLIMDWDVHHGNGTEQYVRDHWKEGGKRLLYASMHYYDGVVYPRTGGPIASNIDGSEAYICNASFSDKGIEDNAYLELFRTRIVPFVANHISSIDTIVISNGLDAHRDDPLQLARLSIQAYVTMTKFFVSLGKRIVFLLEGGYNENVIADVTKAIVDLL